MSRLALAIADPRDFLARGRVRNAGLSSPATVGRAGEELDGVTPRAVRHSAY